jgi:hypothetical protein
MLIGTHACGTIHGLYTIILDSALILQLNIYKGFLIIVSG